MSLTTPNSKLSWSPSSKNSTSSNNNLERRCTVYSSKCSNSKKTRGLTLMSCSNLLLQSKNQVNCYHPIWPLRIIASPIRIQALQADHHWGEDQVQWTTKTTVPHLRVEPCLRGITGLQRGVEELQKGLEWWHRETTDRHWRGTWESILGLIRRTRWWTLAQTVDTWVTSHRSSRLCWGSKAWALYRRDDIVQPIL